MKLHNNALDVCESAQTACNRALAPIVRVNKPHRGRVIEPMVGQCWPDVVDAGPTLTQHRFNVSCLLGASVRNTHTAARGISIIYWLHTPPACWQCSPAGMGLPPHQTPHVHPMLFWWWADIVDGGPTSKQHWVSVCCFLDEALSLISTLLPATLPPSQPGMLIGRDPDLDQSAAWDVGWLTDNSDSGHGANHTTTFAWIALDHLVGKLKVIYFSNSEIF